MKKYNSHELSWLIRRHAIEMAYLSHGSHIGSVLSCADILAVLYCDVLNVYPEDPNNKNRDYFIMSKGHAGSGLYAALAECGFFDTKILKTHYQNGSILSGHVSHKTVPGVDASSGSLGHGLSYAVGISYGLKKDHKKNRVFCLLGDGECQEGSVYEAIGLARQLSLSNLYIIIDYNKMQAMGFLSEIVGLEPIQERYSAMGCEVKRINGHSHKEILDGINSFNENRPHMLICDTINGKGISFMENELLWHYRFPHDGQEYNQSVKELLLKKPKTIQDPYHKRSVR